MRWLFLYIVLFLFGLQSGTIARAQIASLDGKVLDAGQNIPISDVSISTLQKDSLLIDFTISDSNGVFKIKNVSSAACYISFSCLGYRKKIIPVNTFVSGQTIALLPDTFAIKEVLVKSHRIRQQGDTVVYLVDGFKMPQDRSIGDVLNKMPGLEVQSDGRIKYQGKAISKLYIEGSDLLESKYGLAVRNVRAKDIESVEVLENHEAIKALRGVRFNEAAAINLKLKDEAKARWIGIGDAGVGTGHTPLLWDTRLQGMLFGKKQQNFSIYKGNNTGMDVSNELHSLISDQFVTSDQTYLPGLLSPLNTGSPDLDEAYYLQNSSHLLSVNQLWKKDDNRQWRFQASYVNDRIKEDAKYLTEYILGEDDSFIVEENNHTKGRRHHADGELSFEQNLDSLYIKNSLSYKGEFDTYDACVDNRPGIRELRLHMPRQSVTNRFSLIRNSRHKVFRIYSFNQWINRPQRLLNRPDSPDTLFLMPYEEMLQKAGLSTFISHTSTSFQLLVCGFYMGVDAGIKLQSDHIDSKMERLENQTYILMPDSFRNNFSYFRLLTYAEPNISYTGLRERLSASLKLNMGWLYRKNSPDFVFQPKLHVHFKVLPSWDIGGEVSRSYMEDDIRKLYPGCIMNGYRSFLSFSPQYTSRHSDAYTFYSTFKNPMKGVFLSLRGGFVRTKEQFVDRIRFDGIVRYTDRLSQEHIDRSRFVTAKYGQAIAFWNTRLSCEMSYYNSDYLYMLSELSSYRTGSVIMTGNIVMQPLRIMNIDYSVRLKHSNLKIRGEGVLQSFWKSEQQLALNLYPSPNWLFKFSHSFYKDDLPGASGCYFMDIQTLYRFGKDMEIKLSAHNLLGKTLYRIKTIDAYSSIEQSYPLRGREVCVSYSFSF